MHKHKVAAGQQLLPARKRLCVWAHAAARGREARRRAAQSSLRVATSSTGQPIAQGASSARLMPCPLTFTGQSASSPVALTCHVPLQRRLVVPPQA